MKTLLEAVFVVIGFGVIFATIEIVQRKYKISANISRKTAHIISAGGTAFLPYFLSWSVIISSSLMFILIMLVSKRLKIFKSIHGIMRKTQGEIYLPIGIVATALISMSQSVYVFTYALLVLALADTCAELIGRKYGRHKIINAKTLEGSLGFGITAWLVGIVILSVCANVSFISAVGSAFIIGIVATIAEALSPNGIDNLTIPVVVAAMSSILI